MNTSALSNHILTLLLKGDSIEALSEEILARISAATGSLVGVLLFTDDAAIQQLEMENSPSLFYDPSNAVPDRQELIDGIRSNLDYLMKKLSVNPGPVRFDRQSSDTVGSLCLLSGQRGLIIAPVTFNDSILGIFIFIKDSDTYSETDASVVGQFTSLLGLAAGNAVTRKLNSVLELQLQQSQKLETIGRLSSGMAHDFNNLLSGIFGSLNILKKKLSDRDDVSYLLNNIESCSVRAADLTKGLLSYGKPTPKRKTVIHPYALLKELSGVIHQTFPGEISISDNFECNLPDIMGNSTEIYQVLLNLCINSREAIKGNGSISLEASEFVLNDRNQSDLPLLKKGKYVRFSVTDNGEGISEENLSRIFDPYFSTKQKETGGGLGLYVTYGIIKAHNGHIMASSKLKVGTRFDIYIPACEPVEAQTRDSEKIILLADDEVMLRDLLAELLESYNFQVICVGNGLEVLQVLTEEIKADLLIIDYKMPGMDGLECIKEIRDLNIKVPVILSTGSTSHTQDEEFRNLNIDCILTKPYEFEQMLLEVRKLISSPNPDQSF